MSATTVQFRTPEGDTITVQMTETRSGILIEPVSDNPNNVHFHSFEMDGNQNILMRDRFNQNVKAFVLNTSNGSWTERSLTSTEQRQR
jgi:hypothetical protein